jgi:hypothetical protein
MDDDVSLRDRIERALDDWPHCWAVEELPTHSDHVVIGVRVEYLNDPIHFADLETRCRAHGVVARVTALESVDDPEMPRLRLDAHREAGWLPTLAGP